jgi:GntR family transcriptional regulator
MNIIISNSSPDPIYEQISKQILRQILAGELAEGDELPSIRKLALELRISVITTKRAYDDLIRDGFIDSVAGKGTFVATQNKHLLREQKMKIIEEHLTEAVNAAKMLGVRKSDLKEMLNVLYEVE